MSYTISYYHIVIRTYRSEPAIPEDHERELYAYIYGMAKNLKCQTYRVSPTRCLQSHPHISLLNPRPIFLHPFYKPHIMKRDDFIQLQRGIRKNLSIFAFINTTYL